MGEFQDVLIFRADFNNVAKDGRRIKVVLHHGFSRRIPRLGERVLLADSEQNRCWGWVRDFSGVIAFVELDESTWVSGEETRMQVLKAPAGGFSVQSSPASESERVPA